MRLPLAILTSLAAGPALAHAGEAHAPTWSLEWWVVAPLALSALLFGVGWRRLMARSGQGAAGLKRRGLLFAAGWLVLAGAVLSPLHDAGSQSFTAHMIEHELLMLAAAPLLVASEPLAVMLWAFPSRARQALGGATRSSIVSGPWRTLTDPVIATLAQAAVLWIWHMPQLFELALMHEGWHAAQHISFLLSALLFWSAMFHRRRSKALAAACLFATSILGGALGAFMAFSESPWYAPYAALGLAPMGLTPVEDQQLAGLLMWLPGGMIHAAFALVLLGSLLQTREAADARS
ncbi:MAG TPA: cytochrome c oxidase assembly protein [Caulobacteraceae bacterium]|nr:cytochrome c oxidase assembly protein [Caulobacteraceae bacterium]